MWRSMHCSGIHMSCTDEFWAKSGIGGWVWSTVQSTGDKNTKIWENNSQRLFSEPHRYSKVIGGKQNNETNTKILNE